ncbi:hypothetical protein BGP_2827 [Beggiatoa sp. PS]|nr:hypothetical protein BGP_2827 [Beggiatoa sp. PS]
MRKILLIPLTKVGNSLTMGVREFIFANALYFFRAFWDWNPI